MRDAMRLQASEPRRLLEPGVAGVASEPREPRMARHGGGGRAGGRRSMRSGGTEARGMCGEEPKPMEAILV